MIALHPSVAANGVSHRNWTEEAACRGMGPDRFYPFVEEEDEDVHAAAAAKAVCASCPVREDCLTTAIQTREQYGIWGGLTSRERRRMIRRARRARARNRAAA